MSVFIPMATARSLLDIMGGKPDANGGQGHFDIYGGVRPVNCDTAIGAQTKLAVGTFSADSFAAAIANGTSEATALANFIQDFAGIGAGVGTWARVFTSTGVVCWDCSVTDSTGNGDIKLSDATISPTTLCSVTSFIITQPTGAA